MAKRFRHVAIVGKYQAQGIRPQLEELAHFLIGLGLEVAFERDTAQGMGITDFDALTHDAIGQRCDLAVVVGGDGTMLGSARQLARFDTPLVGINQGRLGFITDIAQDRSFDALRPIIAGDFEEEQRSMIEGDVWRDGERIFSGLSLNDVVVSRGATASMVELRIEVNGDFVANLRADGLIVATPTGSTAYALSCNGPILHPTLQGLVLVPVAPQALSNRPIVLPAHSAVSIAVTDGREPRINCDMQTFADLHVGDVLDVRRAEHGCKFLHPVGYSYYATLRSKLHWHEMPNLGPRP
jgi:NAD+ kinase